MGTADLHVLIYQEGDYWFAQGVERDIVASADSFDQIRRNFERGLAATLHCHGSLDDIGATPEPVIAEIWNDLMIVDRDDPSPTEGLAPRILRALDDIREGRFDIWRVNAAGKLERTQVDAGKPVAAEQPRNRQ